MNKKLHKILLLGLAFLMSFSAQATKPDNEIDSVKQALILGVIRGIVAVCSQIFNAGRLTWDHDYQIALNNQLLSAASRGQVAAIEALLATGADMHAVDEDGYTPLHLAAWNGQVAAIEALLAAGAHVHAVDEHGYTPLHLALIQAGAHVHVLDDDGVHIRWNLVNVHGVNSQCVYADKSFEQNYVEAVKALINNNGVVDFKILCEWLLKLNNNKKLLLVFNQMGIDLNLFDNLDETLLHLAAWNGLVSAIKVLLAAGADVNAVDNSDRTPLHFSIMRGHALAMNTLLVAGADVNAVDNFGRTPLHEALDNWYGFNYLNTLLESGANVHVVKIDRWNAIITNREHLDNQGLELVMWLLGHNMQGIDWTNIFRAVEISAFLTAPNAEAIEPIAAWIERVIQNNVSYEVRQALAVGLGVFLGAIRNNQVMDRATGQLIILRREQQALIEGLIEQLYAGSTTKSARNVVEVIEDKS
jgi:ankyrin repeat protein